MAEHLERAAGTDLGKLGGGVRDFDESVSCGRLAFWLGARSQRLPYSVW